MLIDDEDVPFICFPRSLFSKKANKISGAKLKELKAYAGTMEKNFRSKVTLWTIGPLLNAPSWETMTNSCSIHNGKKQ